MAIGTPVSRGSDKRFATTSDLTLDTFTSAADELLLCFVHVPASSATPDSVSGHDGKQSWVQIGSTEVTNSESYSLWGAISSGASSTAITVQRSTSSLMTAVAISVTGCDEIGRAHV